MTYVLWTVQVLLRLLFVFTGETKLVLPLEVLTEQTPLSGWFVRFLSVAEVLGAVGLILTGLVGVRPGLTPLAALWAGRDYCRRNGARLGGGRARRRSRASADPAGGGAPLG
jgi:DoxX-like family